MLQEVVLPRLGQTVEAAMIEKWRVKEGDAVRKGDVLLEITTDKATLEVESFVEGTVLKVLAAEGEEIAVDAVIAYVGDPKTDKAPATAPKPAPPKKKAETAEAAGVVRAADAAGPAAAGAPAGRIFISPRAKKLAETELVTPLAMRGTGPNGRIVEDDVAAYAERVSRLLVSPTARKLAYESGVDLLSVKGTGESARIMKEDVEKAPPVTVGAAAAGGRRVELTAARRVIAERMSKSKREAPHFYLQMDVDMTGAVAMREELKAAGTKISFHDMIIKALAVGFKEVPMMNAAWGGNVIVVNSAIDVSLAVALPDGLMVPVVRGADRLDLRGIAEQTSHLIEKARTKRLAPFEYEGGSITLSNLGMYDVTSFIPIINPGQASILGVGRIADKPVVVNGGIAVRKIMSVTLAGDHRVADGATAAAFLKVVKDSLESPREKLS